ncbi:MAG: molybdopterin molybdenumtransferase MoeA [Calditrichaeota bacterium]|nr:MAG: molybdopterin molybdenumtransferase MoeA [Calditrichota bacterium]
MISISEALTLVRNHIPPRKTETIEITNAVGRYLADDIAAREPSPRYTNSAMDGFAVRWADVQTATPENPVELSIIAESQVGIPFQGELQPGEAIRINTGAMLCAGADTVVPVEDVQISKAKVIITKVKKKGAHVRQIGEEFQTGDTLLQQGICLQPFHIALLASQGISTIPVYSLPKVAIIITGTELKPYASEEIEPWQIRDSNGIMLKTAVERWGGKVISLQHVGDDLSLTTETLQRVTGKADIIIFSGGVSVGEHDFVKSAATQSGFKTVFWKVNQKPGKPLFVARHEQSLLFGLPGNPVSAYMCFTLYIQPVLKYLSGGDLSPTTLSVECGEDISNKIDRANMLRVKIISRNHERPLISVLPKQGSHMLTSLTSADGFLILEPRQTLEKGSIVSMYPF